MKKERILSTVFSSFAVIILVLFIVWLVSSMSVPKYFFVQDYGTLFLCVVLAILLPTLLIGGAVFGAYKNLTCLSALILMLSIIYVPVWLAVSFYTSTICSYTTDTCNFCKFDAYVDAYMQRNSGYDVLSVDEESGQVISYYYMYIPTENAFIVHAEIEYQNIDSYQRELDRLTMFEQKQEGGYVKLYSTFSYAGMIELDPYTQTISYVITNTDMERWSTQRTGDG